MNDRPATVPFAPRTVSNCLDLAVLFCGRQLLTFLTLWACAAVPACGLIYVLSYHFELGLRTALVLIYFASALLGGWLIAAVTPGLFQPLVGGDEGIGDDGRRPPAAAGGYLGFAACLLAGGLIAMSLAAEARLGGWQAELSLAAAVLLSVVMFARALLLVRERGCGRIGVTRPLLAALAMRIAVGFLPLLSLLISGWAGYFVALLFAAIPGLLLAVRIGFATERACVTQLEPRLHNPRTDRLIHSQMSDLFLRLCGICLFCFLLWGVLYCTLDMLLTLLFQSGLVIGRLGEIDIGSGQFANYLTTDPLLLTAVTATALLVYPIARLAWFLCYIDLRVRRDCWDLELGLSAEAHRLKGTA